MKKSEAFDILSEVIRDLCLNDLIYTSSTDKGWTEIMIAALSEIKTAEELLTELVKKDGECRDDSSVC